MRNVYASIFFVAVLWTAAVPSVHSEPSISPRTHAELEFFPTDFDLNGQLTISSSDRISPDSCSSHFPGSSGFFVPGYPFGDATYFAYVSPAISSCSPAIPFGITGMKTVLCYNSACNTNIVFQVFDAIGTVCPQPGALLYSSPVVPLQFFGGPACASINYVFDDTVCVNGPFFLSYTFPNGAPCLNLATDTLPGTCQSYELTTDGTLTDLYYPGFPGQLWMQAFGLDSAESHCAPIPDTVVSIPDVYRNLATMEGKTVKVLGSYIHPSDNKLVTSYAAYQLQQLMPSQSVMIVTGAVPDSLYWLGGIVSAIGNISKKINPNPVYPSDSFDVSINVLYYEYHIEGDTTTPPPSNMDNVDHGNQLNLENKDAEACDPCKFAMLISGGGDAYNNHPGFWKDIEKLYQYKTDPSGGNHCPENVKILYFDGNSDNNALIPDNNVDPCTKANISAAHDDIAAKIAACKLQGKKTTVQKMVTNHGTDDAGIVTTGTERVSPTEFKNMQQKLIDAGCDFLIDEFVTCFGGDMVNGLKDLNDKGHTEIHVNSAAGASSPAVADVLKGSRYLDEKIARLRAGDDYEKAVAAAKTAYAGHVGEVIQKQQGILQKIFNKINGFPVGHPNRKKWEDLRDDVQNVIDRLQQSSSQGSPSFVRYQFKEYCEWKKIVVPPPGQFKFTFNGRGGCGNVSVYCEEANGTKTRVKVWNWNLPISFGYTSGNEQRVLNANAPCPGVYWIHNDNGEFTVTVEALKTQTLPESPSNQSSFSGFSVGGTDSSGGEFSNITQPSYSLSGLDQIGLQLTTLPATIGTNNGVAVFNGNFTMHANPWQDSIELVIQVNQVTRPGVLQLQCSGAQIPLQQQVVNLNTAEIVFYLGMIQANPTVNLTFTAGAGLVFSWDAWGLRTRKATAPNYVCGDADGNGIITISDAVYLINYIFGGGPSPNPLLSGDSDCSGGVNISDAVYMINYVFSGGAPPCAACQ